MNKLLSFSILGICLLVMINPIMMLTLFNPFNPFRPTIPWITSIKASLTDEATDNPSISVYGNVRIYITGRDFGDSDDMHVAIGSQNGEIITYTTTFIELIAPAQPSGPGEYKVEIWLDGWDGDCDTEEKKCTITYSEYKTAKLYEVSPNTAVARQSIALSGIYRQQKTSPTYLTEFKIGDTWCDRTGYSYNNINANSIQDVSCTVAKDIEAGFYDIHVQSRFIGELKEMNSIRKVHPTTDEEYSINIIPNINEIISTKGSPNGQILTIMGDGFAKAVLDNSVSIGNKPCTVISSCQSEIKCEIGKVEFNAEDKLIGGAGFLEESYQITSDLTLDDFKLKYQNSELTLKDTNVILEIETSSKGSNIGKVVKGFFKALITGKHKFYISANGESQLFISLTDKNIESLTSIAQLTTAFSSSKNFFIDAEQQSAELDLVQDNYYYIEFFTMQKEYKNQYSVAVEIEQSESNVNSKYQSIIMKTNYEPNYYQMKITLFNNVLIDTDNLSGSWEIRNGNEISTQKLSWGDSTSKVYSAIKEVLGYSNMEIELELLDETNNVITDNTQDIYGYSYIVTVKQYKFSYPLPSVKNNLLLNESPLSLQIQTITEIQAASPPVRGTFIIRYKEEVSQELSYKISSQALFSVLVYHLGLSDQIIIETSGNSDWNYQWKIDLLGHDSNIPLSDFSIDCTKITGGDENIATPDITIEEITTYSHNAFWNPVQTLFLHQYQTTPQVVVTSNSIKGTCLNNNCGYEIDEANTPVLESYTVDFVNKEILMTISNIFTEEQNDIQIIFGEQNCTLESLVKVNDNLELTCKLPIDSNDKLMLPPGNFLPIIHFTGIGYSLIKDGIIETQIEPVISSISPLSASLQGNLQITISGEKLYAKEKEDVQILIGGKSCKIKSICFDEIVFWSPISEDPLTDQVISITINGLVAPADSFKFTFKSDANIPSISSITPTHSSPTQKTDITIIGTNFDGTTDNYECFLIDSDKYTNESEIEILYTVSVWSINTEKTEMTVVFGGGKQASYKVLLYKKAWGAVYDSSNSLPDFEYKSIISSVSPNKGSRGGGTIITITGEGFSKTMSQNEVFIDEVTCSIISATQQEIQCITGWHEIEGTFNVQVRQRKQEMADCISCEFSYINARTPYISDTFTEPLAIWKGKSITINGGLLQPQTNENVKLVLGEYEIIADSFNAIQATFTCPSIPIGIYPMKLVVGNYGIARFGSLESQYPFQIESQLKLDSVSPIEFSQGGTILTIKGSGFNGAFSVKIGSQVCHIINLALDEISCYYLENDATGKNVLITSDFTKEGITTEVTSSEILTQSEAKTIKSTNSNAFTYTLSTNDPLIIDITGTQLDNTINSVSLIQESNFQNKIEGSVVEPQNAESLQLSFAQPQAGKYKLLVEFTDFGYLKFNEGIDIVTIDAAPLSVTAIDSSFAGGSILVLDGFGLPQSINDDAIINVCNEKCQILETSQNQIKCKTPKITTQELNDELTIKTSSLQSPQIYLTDKDIDPLTNDQTTLTYYYSGSDQCFITYDYGEDNLIELHEIRYFGSHKANIVKQAFEGAKFQGSVDGVNFEDIFEITYFMTSFQNYWAPEEGETKKSYRFIRFYHDQAALYEKEGKKSYCSLAEFNIYGIRHQQVSISNDELVCSVNVNLFGSEQILSSKVTYKKAATSKVTSINPTYGNSNGGTEVTISGTNFGTDKDNTIVEIDGVACGISSISSSEIICTTNIKTGYDNTSGLQIYIPNNGQAITTNINFFYVELWSEQSTWGGELPPRDGDSAYIKKNQHVLLDESTAKLFAVIIEGSLILDDDATSGDSLTMDAHYIVCSKGRIQIGSQDKPYTKKLTITLHGSIYDTQLPQYGNKVIGVSNGILDIHGKKRNKVWTYLKQSAFAGSLTITVEEPVDWVEGEVIAISTMDFNLNHTEPRKIIAVSDDKTILTLNETLTYDHYSAVESYGSEEFPMKCEVGLLTRNIKIQGDDDSIQTGYGVHTIATGYQDQGSITRISYVEFDKCGQERLSKGGRDPIHLYLGGKKDLSWVEGNSVHHSFSRLIALHGVHNVRVENNVGYDIYGSAILLEGGVETQNIIKDNLIMLNKQSWRLLQTDTSASSIMIRHPTNIVMGNHVAGGMFGISYYFPGTPQGTTADPAIWPEGNPLGQMGGNVCHGFEMYGFRGALHYPRTKPYQYPWNMNNKDHWADNPTYQVVYEDITSFKNNQHGIQFEQIGEVLIRNLKVADNKISGIVVFTTNSSRIGTAKIEDALVVGLSQGNAASERGDIVVNKYVGFKGISTPGVDGLSIENIRFHNFYFVNDDYYGSAIGTCTNCEGVSYGIYEDGGCTVHFKQVTFTNVDKKIFWNLPRREVIHDEDGSIIGSEILTELEGDTSSGAWLAPYFPHLNQKDKCKRLKIDDFKIDLWNDTIACRGKDSQMRTMQFRNYQPMADFRTQILNIYRISNNYDESELFDYAQYADDERSTTDLLLNMWHWRFMEIYTDPYSWMFNIPFLTGERYRVWWGNRDIMDWNYLWLKPSYDAAQDDLAYILEFNHTMPRELYRLYPLSCNKIEQYENGTNKQYEVKDSIDENSLHGEYSHKHSEEGVYVSPGLLSIAVRGDDNATIAIKPVYCDEHCPSPLDACNGSMIEGKWSDPEIWTKNFNGYPSSIPIEGEDVKISACLNLTLDVDTAILKNLQIDGELHFDPEREISKVNAINIWIRGKLQAGTKDEPFPNKIEFNIYGTHEDYGLAIDQEVEAGTKIFLVTGEALLYSQPPQTLYSRLSKYGNIGDTIIEVTEALDWEVGDELMIAPTEFEPHDYEQKKIVAIDGNQITLDSELQYNHYGAPETITTNAGILDMRASVGHLSRKIKIQSILNEDLWGVHVLVAAYNDENEDGITELDVLRRGVAKFTGVEIAHCSQPVTRACIHFRNTQVGENQTSSEIIASTMNAYDYGKCVYAEHSNNFTFQGNVMTQCRKYGMELWFDNNYLDVHDNLILGVNKRLDISSGPWAQAFEITAGIDMHVVNWVSIQGRIYNFTGNIAQGVEGYGYIIPGMECSTEKHWFLDNQAGSSYIGLCLWSNITECNCLHNYVGYKNNLRGAESHFPQHRIETKNVILAENKIGFHLSFAKTDNPWHSKQYVPYDKDHYDNTLLHENLYLAAIARPDCTECYKTAEDCSNLFGYRSSVADPVPMCWDWLSWNNVQDLEKFDAIEDTGNFDNKMYIKNSKLQYWRHDYSVLDKPHLAMCSQNYIATTYSPGFEDICQVTYTQNTDCEECTEQGMAYFKDASESNLGWLGGCGEIKCTGPSNWFIEDTDGQFMGQGTPMQFLCNNPELFEKDLLGCARVNEINGYSCMGTQFTRLHFEAYGFDKYLRLNCPVHVASDHGETIVNCNMEWIWDGSVPLNKRLNRFNAIVKKGNYVNITFNTTPFDFYRYQLIKGINSERDNDFIIAQVWYMEYVPFIKVLANDQEVKPFAINSKIDLFDHKDTCGANIFHGSNNTIIFVINSIDTCEIKLIVTNAVFGSLRFDTMEELFDQSSFVDIICAFLGISTDQLKINNIRKGSTIVDLYLFSDKENNEENKELIEQDLSTYKKKLEDGIESSQLKFNDPLLDYSFSMKLSQTSSDFTNTEEFKIDELDVTEKTENLNTSSSSKGKNLKGIEKYLLVIGLPIFCGLIIIFLAIIFIRRIIRNKRLKQIMSADKNIKMIKTQEIWQNPKCQNPLYQFKTDAQGNLFSMQNIEVIDLENSCDQKTNQQKQSSDQKSQHFSLEEFEQSK